MDKERRNENFWRRLNKTVVDDLNLSMDIIVDLFWAKSDEFLSTKVGGVLWTSFLKALRLILAEMVG